VSSRHPIIERCLAGLIPQADRLSSITPDTWSAWCERRCVVTIGIIGNHPDGAEALVRALLAIDPTIRRLAIADEIHRHVIGILGIPSDWIVGPENDVPHAELGAPGWPDLCGRDLVQACADEAGNSPLGRGFWMAAWRRAAVCTGATTIVVPDIRHADEAALVRRHGSIIAMTVQNQVGPGHSLPAHLVDRTFTCPTVADVPACGHLAQRLIDIGRASYRLCA